MNTTRFITLSRLVLAAGVVAASASAHAGGVYWAVNVDAPVVGMGRVSTAVSNTPRGVYVQPAPVVYAPAPVIVHPQPVVYAPAPVVVQPVRYEERCRPWGWRHHHHHEWREAREDWRRGGDWDDRDEYRRGR